MSVNDAEPIACCTKIILIQYPQAMIENLVIYSFLYSPGILLVLNRPSSHVDLNESTGLIIINAAVIP